jgi:antitoxin ChpS
MEVKIQQWGNSAAIRLPSTLLKQMSLVSGDVLLLNVDPDAQAITLKPTRAKPL